MSLSTTLSIAQSALSTNAALSTIVSRNIAGVNDPNYSTKNASAVTTLDGGVEISGIRSATDTALFNNLLGAKSDAASASALSEGLGQLEQTLGLSSTTAADGTSTDSSPATLLGNLTNALQSYAASPTQATLGQAAVTAAKTLATSLNAASSTVQSVRAQADKDLASAVASVNSLLQQFGAANAAVVSANIAGTDGTDALDTRNTILQSLSSQLGITTADAGNGGLALYTDGGATLFQGTARKVSFTPTASYGTHPDGSAVVGNAVLVDGVPVTGTSATMASKSGAIAGLAQLRDTVAVDYGHQLDQIAGGLISAFSEKVQADGTSVPGLFTVSNATTTAFASTITVAASVDPSKKGDVTLLRDGGIAGAGTKVNTDATATSYSANLTAMLATLDSVRQFDGTSGGAASGTLSAYAASSVSWLETNRQAASTASTDKAALVTQTTTNLSSATGVNLDEQLSKMLDLEHSYQASAELLTTVKSMLDSLLQAVN